MIKENIIKEEGIHGQSNNCVDVEAKESNDAKGKKERRKKTSRCAVVDEEQLVKDYLEGCSVHTLGERYHAGAIKVRVIIDAHGIRRRKRGDLPVGPNGEPFDMEKFIEEYKAGLGFETLAIKYHIGIKRAKQILLDNGIELRPKNGQALKDRYDENNYAVEKYKPVDGKHYVAISKDGKFSSKDYLNLAGHLSTCIKNEYGVTPPGVIEKKEFYDKTGNYWWEEWFDVVLFDNKEVKKCPYCDWETCDISNRSGQYGMHILKVHGITPEEHLRNHPEDIDFFPDVKKQRHMEELFKNEDNYVVCPLCGKKMMVMTAKHLMDAHQMTSETFRQLYPDFRMICQSIIAATSGSMATYNESIYIDVEAAKRRFEEAKERFSDLETVEPIWDTYERYQKPMRFICHKKDAFGMEHGEFSNKLEYILAHGKWCLKCGHEKTAIPIDEAKERISNFQGMSHIDINWNSYVNLRTPIECYCHNKTRNGKEHGKFSISFHALQKGSRCPRCSKHHSNAENEIYAFVKELCPDAQQGNRVVLGNRKELDIYVPSVSFGIEYNGLYWHSELNGKGQSYHLDKLNAATEKGIRLINVYEDVWNNHKDAVLRFIRRSICPDSLYDLSDWILTARELSEDDAFEFCDANSVKDFASGAVYFGTIVDGDVIACLTFTDRGDGVWELYDVSLSPEYAESCAVFIGAFSLFVEDYEPSRIEAMADRSWYNGNDNVYSIIGMTYDGEVEPTCSEYMDNDGNESFVWNCGYYKYVWKK